jgi:hypothetical protein
MLSLLSLQVPSCHILAAARYAEANFGEVYKLTDFFTQLILQRISLIFVPQLK